MHIHAGVEVSVRFIVTVRAPEQFAPFHLDAASGSVGEPLALDCRSGSNTALVPCGLTSDGHGARMAKAFSRAY